VQRGLAANMSPARREWPVAILEVTYRYEVINPMSLFITLAPT